MLFYAIFILINILVGVGQNSAAGEVVGKLEDRMYFMFGLFVVYS